jgi:hypothetical protein
MVQARHPISGGTKPARKVPLDHHSAPFKSHHERGHQLETKEKRLAA